jgi:hypothetical protein
MRRGSSPTVVPVPMPTGGNEGNDNITTTKSFTKLDESLDNFVSMLFKDCALAFGDRYKKYVYESNIGHAFS